MRVKKFLITIVVLCTFCSCSKGGNGLGLELSPSDKNLAELVSQTYSDSQLLEIAQFNGSIRELNTHYPIECVRESGNAYRVSYFGDSSIAVITFDDAGNRILGNVYSALRLKADFDVLVNGQSLNNVQKIDPNGEYPFLYTGRNDLPKISTHYTRDGYLITIEYDDSNVISNIQEELI